jgi:hypothetical protein
MNDWQRLVRLWERLGWFGRIRLLTYGIFLLMLPDEIDLAHPHTDRVAWMWLPTRGFGVVAHGVGWNSAEYAAAGMFLAAWNVLVLCYVALIHIAIALVVANGLAFTFFTVEALHFGNVDFALSISRIAVLSFATVALLNMAKSSAWSGKL